MNPTGSTAHRFSQFHLAVSGVESSPLSTFQSTRAASVPCCWRVLVGSGGDGWLICRAHMGISQAVVLQRRPLFGAPTLVLARPKEQGTEQGRLCFVHVNDLLKR